MPIRWDTVRRCIVCGGLVGSLVAGKLTHRDPANETHAAVVRETLVRETLYAELDDSHREFKAFAGLETWQAEVGQATSSDPPFVNTQMMDAANQAARQRHAWHPGYYATAFMGAPVLWAATGATGSTGPASFSST